MKIQKLLHSCLLVEENGKQILIDPGTFSFDEQGNIDTLPYIDAILITHNHGDHASPVVIKKVIARDNTPVFGNSDVVELLSKEGIPVTLVSVPSTFETAGFTIEATVAPHEPLPRAIPENNGFLINARLFTPGDSHSFETGLKTTPEVLALPTLAPWGTFTRAMEIALRMKPKHIIPAHDGFVKEQFLVHQYARYSPTLEQAGIKLHPLKPGEILEV